MAPARLSVFCALAVLAVSAALCRAEPLQVVTEEWFPYNYQEHGEAKGSASEVVKAVLKQAGVPYTIRFLAWARAYHVARTQPNVLIYTIERLPNRESEFKWVRPLGGSSSFWLYRLKSHPLPPIHSLQEAKAYTIGCPSQNGAECTVLTYMGFTHLEVPPEMSGLIKMFLANRFDLMVGEKQSIAPALLRQRHAPDEVVPVLEVFRSLPYMALSNATPDALVQKLQTAFDTLQREGKIQPIR